MAYSEEYLTFVLGQLAEFGHIEVKKMFGGIGLFHEGRMFGKVGGNTLYLKVDAHNADEYKAKGMEPFYSARKKKGMPYWEVPPDVLENADHLVQWASKAFEAALRAKP